MSKVYQQTGSIRVVRRAKGIKAWEWRYRLNGIMKQETFSREEFPTEKALWSHIAKTRLGRLNEGVKPDAAAPSPIVTIGDVIRMYRKEHLMGLAKSTRGTDESMLDVHIEPRWSGVVVDDLKPLAVSKWLETLDLSASTKGRAKRILKQLIDKAILWELIPDRPNPMRLVRVKGSTLRDKEVVTLSVAEFNRLFDALPVPLGLMILVAGSLGLRVSEIVALKWEDFDWERKTVRIQRAFTHGELKITKTVASKSKLPLPDGLLEALKEYQPTVDSEWVFPSPVTGGPRWGNILLHDHIRPVAKELGLPPHGWHTYRHSYASWLSAGEASLVTQMKAMRHSKVEMTMQYGRTPTEVMRPHVDAVSAPLHSNKPAPS
jgi:integrase